MNNILKSFIVAIMAGEKNPILYILIVSAVFFSVMGLLDVALAIGLFVVFFLSIVTIFVLSKFGVQDKRLYIIFLIAILSHIAAVVFIYYGHFRPFGGGTDFEGYHQNAVDVAQRFLRGDFSLRGLSLVNNFPVLIGAVYAVSLPEMIIGQIFTVWLAGISVVLAYLLVLEIGGTKKMAFLAVSLAIFYPSYLYFGSILLKDTLVIPLVLAGLFILLKMLKHFTWLKFLGFFIVLTALIHFRFYVGYALMFTLIISWPIISQYHIKKRTAHWLAMTFLLGLSPLILGSGYYGSYHYKEFLNPGKITYFREVVYTANSPLNPQPVASPQPPAPQPPAPQPPAPQPESPKPAFEGSGSTFVLETGLNNGPVTFLKNSFQSFIYSLLGPFPWQFHNQRQLVGLAETIPWYLLIACFFYTSVKRIKKGGVLSFFRMHKLSFPLLVFSMLALSALSLYINNYGIIARIRIPVFICLIVVMSVTVGEYLEQYHIYEKVFTGWRSRIHRLSFIKRAAGTGQ